MNEVTKSFIRTGLKVGGAVLATSGFLPAQCSITDPVIAQVAGVITVILGSFWGINAADKHQQLKELP